MQVLLETWWQIGGAVAAGAAIGFEREFRARPAGFRTHTLVCLASALLIIAASRMGEWVMVLPAGTQIISDPARMAHGVLTGIGFLCAGVIFREGFNIHGLTTAASLWITSALGVLWGVGLLWLALMGTAVTLVVLVIFRIIDSRLPKLVTADLCISLPPGQKLDEAGFRALLAEVDVRPNVVRQRHTPDGRWELSAKVKSYKDLGPDRLARRLADAFPQAYLDISPRED